ncbi:beta-aspartyl-peptidase [Gottfriedia solisilvae]|uniref:Isoaspartyl dipeptidase n=1 Tax=Gottfriedia solisilvae TaxID=1516104 RepID=A0A8J3AK64_9BACI|nr:beta-aspartyl-peptidase [Gottfriedia solisilvae]GGI12467.1 isoaspartyl dipeptidase [Gottfriedia solisilvae]
MILIKNGEVYSPTAKGEQDILVSNDKIAFIQKSLALENTSLPIQILDASNCYIVPGFIDSHVHLIGGGGEGGFKTRTPELLLSDCIKSGITTVIGVLGTDGTTRTMPSLLAKCRALEEEGITSYVYTGSYQTPVKTLFSKIEEDIILIDKIIGVGEIAISDHRSSQPTKHELARIAAEARNGGLLSGKSGVVNLHIGDSKSMLSMIEEIIDETELPITQFYPTHINRNSYLFEAGIHYAKKGGYVDFTTSTIPHFIENGEVKCSVGLKRMLNSGVNIEQITFTSDGQASLPDFDENGVLRGMKIGRVNSLYQEVKDAIINEGIPIEEALKVITSNPARILKLHNKGHISEGYDADLVFLNKKTLEIETVISKGRVMLQNGELLVKGTFE